MKLSPLAKVNKRFGSKEALVKQVIPMLDKDKDESKDDFKSRINSLSNSKLMRLFDNHTRVKDEFGSKTKLVDKIMDLKKPVNSDKIDKDYRNKLLTLRVARLLEIYRIAKKRS